MTTLKILIILIYAITIIFAIHKYYRVYQLLVLLNYEILRRIPASTNTQITDCDLKKIRIPIALTDLVVGTALLGVVTLLAIDPRPLVVTIQSGGSSLFAGIALFNSAMYTVQRNKFKKNDNKEPEKKYKSELEKLESYMEKR